MTTVASVGERRRLAIERADARRGHSIQRALRPTKPPPTAFYLVIVVVTVLIMLGLVMVFSASSITALHRNQSPWRIFNRQLLWAILGLGALVMAARIHYHRWRRWSSMLLLGAYGLMLLPFVPGIGTSVNGARAWVYIGSFGFQPSEFLKLALLIFCADLLAKRETEMADLGRTLKPMMVVALLGAGMCLAQGDLGSAIVIAAIVFVVAFLA
ncbi:MAG TPA: FtsW/RodA/SpoVE family cell cycle protein, partial [Ilumatobacteraceae bacterium]|nr:FtsW/RodA/SpoVE family cell cycle protein [Ilumatobacteraceae bacterium]